MSRTFTDRCNLAETCLPPAGYRNQLRMLHSEMLDRIIELEEELREAKQIQIDEMVNRFLGWRLPENFYPDCGITFKHIDTWGGYPNNWPIGTNLFTANQAKVMFEHALGINTK